MSIILKGINLPEKNMRVICLFPNGAEELVVLDADSGAIAGRPIQAVQIPKGHGRLIDADKIDYDEFWHREGQGFTIAVCQGAEKIIDEQPTILEAEENE